MKNYDLKRTTRMIKYAEKANLFCKKASELKALANDISTIASEQSNFGKITDPDKINQLKFCLFQINTLAENSKYLSNLMSKFTKGTLSYIELVNELTTRSKDLSNLAAKLFAEESRCAHSISPDILAQANKIKCKLPRLKCFSQCEDVVSDKKFSYRLFELRIQYSDEIAIAVLKGYQFMWSGKHRAFIKYPAKKNGFIEYLIPIRSVFSESKHH